MDPERWRKIEQLYHLALEQEPGQQNRFLAGACQGDAELRGEVESLLAQTGGTELLVDETAWAEADDVAATRTVLTPGARLGPYQVLGPLGEGGMGKVYRGMDTRLDRAVAIKISTEQFTKRFEREARAISALNHPHICTLYDVGPNYLVTELVEGETLREWLRRALPVERSLEIARQVLEALRAAHRAGIIHRDLKPENVMVRFDGYVKVLDFGLATRVPASRTLQAESAVTIDVTLVEPNAGDVGNERMSVPGHILGTIAYMSPEQIQGQDIDQRSDLFAFGIMFYEMLTAQHPWPRRSPVDTLHAILHDDPPPIQVTSLIGAELSAIAQKLLRKSPAERYPLAEAVLETLASHTAPRGSSAVTPAIVKPLTSLAVLPFVFLTEVEERKALSLGFADALITMLASLEEITVLPTSAILNYAAGTDPARACRDLGVHYVLQGNVQKLGGQWRVSMQLFDAMTQKITLSEKHDFMLKSVFDVQDEIGRRVAESLQIRFPRPAPRSRDRYSADPQAFDEFMLGLRDSYSDREESIRSADRHLSRAVERDPEFALAHAWLSHVSMQIHYYFDAQRTWLDKAEHHCHRALALDPGLPEGHWARSAILWSPAKNFQHADAIAALEHVLAVRPNFDRAHNRMAAICLHIGRFHEARTAHEHAMRSNPKNRTYNLEWIYLCSGDFARAEEAAEAWLREAPTNLSACWFCPQPPLMTGDLNVAEQRLAAGLERYPDEALLVSLQGMLHARRHETGAALECVRKALEVPITFGHAHHTYYQVACVYAVLGETDKAMAWLERSVDTGNPCWPFFQVDPHLESLRPDPRFKRLLADLERQYTTLKIQRV
jgi:TolB-like protein/predicted Ser/Thr protein kinase